MKASSVAIALKNILQAGHPAFIWGKPGIGKSDVVRQVADDLFAEKYGFKIDKKGRLHDKKGKFIKDRPYLIDIRAVLLDPVDLRGIPSVNGDKLAHWCQPSFWPREGEGIIFLDELPQAPPLTQSGLMQLTLEGKIGEYSKPVGWHIIAAGNRETDKSGAHRMNMALANRFVHINFDCDLDEWIKWALSHEIQTEIIAWTKFRPEMFNNFDPQKTNEKAWCSSRTLEFLSNLMNTKPLPEIEYDLYSGTIGEVAATDFVGFLRIFRNLPNPDLILLNPEKASVPKDPATMYALCGALGHKANDQNIGQVIKYANRMPDEFNVLMMATFVFRPKPELASCRAAIEWFSKHADVIL
jgi:hypothetical protein